MPLSPLLPNQIKILPAEYQKLWGDRFVMCRVGTIGDGSCFFHALARALNYYEFSHLQISEQKKKGLRLREKFLNHITRENWDIFKKNCNVPEYFQTNTFRSDQGELVEDSAWADEMMIRFCSDALRKNIVFINAGLSPPEMYCGVHGRKDEETVVILWVGGGTHFETCVRLHSLTDRISCTCEKNKCIVCVERMTQTLPDIPLFKEITWKSNGGNGAEGREGRVSSTSKAKGAVIQYKFDYENDRTFMKNLYNAYCSTCSISRE